VEQPASQVAAPPPAHAAVLAVVQKLDSQLHVQGYVNFSEFSLMDDAFHIRNVLNADRDPAITSERIRLRNNLDYFFSPFSLNLNLFILL
jgi:hypothetical protein